MTMLLVAFLLEYLPKIYHSVRVLRRMQHAASGYVFGTIWWGIALNLMAYFVAAHVSQPPLSSCLVPLSPSSPCIDPPDRSRCGQAFRRARTGI